MESSLTVIFKKVQPDDRPPMSSYIMARNLLHDLQEGNYNSDDLETISAYAGIMPISKTTKLTQANIEKLVILRTNDREYREPSFAANEILAIIEELECLQDLGKIVGFLDTHFSKKGQNPFRALNKQIHSLINEKDGILREKVDDHTEFCESLECEGFVTNVYEQYNNYISRGFSCPSNALEYTIPKVKERVKAMEEAANNVLEKRSIITIQDILLHRPFMMANIAPHLLLPTNLDHESDYHEQYCDAVVKIVDYALRSANNEHTVIMALRDTVLDILCDAFPNQKELINNDYPLQFKP